MTLKQVALDIIEQAEKGQIQNKEGLEKAKIQACKKYGLDNIPKNADIYQYYKGNDRKIKQLFRIKPVRTLSGVANIAVMYMDDCPGQCIYCPRGKNSPQSYTGCEPATLRAKRYDYKPHEQVENRLKQLRIIGHKTDKCELIIMGGTFPSYEWSKQKDFIKKCYDAFNKKKSSSLKQSQKANETAPNRVIGLTIETRPDYSTEKHVKRMLALGCTRVELGVQTTDNKLLKKINRGHDTSQTIKATRLLKEYGLKVCYHWLPGLTGLSQKNLEKELNDFRLLFIDKRFRPDELKIYPLLVIPGTEICQLYKQGKYQPLTIGETKELIIQMKQHVPKYVRIKRVMRDISHKKVAAGPSITNLRQLIKQEMAKRHMECNCIRCREIGDNKIKQVEEEIIQYKASGGKEYFISYVTDNRIIGFLRLRLGKKAFVRQLHVYGPMAGLHEDNQNQAQHSAFGRKLLAKAENLTKNKGYSELHVTSGTGAREYYRKLGYTKNRYYMTKELK